MLSILFMRRKLGGKEITKKSIIQFSQNNFKIFGRYLRVDTKYFSYIIGVHKSCLIY